MNFIALIILLVALVLFVRYYPEKEEDEEEENESAVEETVEESGSPLNIEDEDATVACLVAAIECRNQYHKNVQIVSVREVK